MTIRIYRTSIIAFLMYHVVFVSINYVHFSTTYTRLLRIFLILASVILLLTKKGLYKLKKDDSVYLFIILYTLIIILSAIINHNITYGIEVSISILFFYYFMAYAQSIERCNEVIDVFYYCTFGWLLVNDCLMLATSLFNGSNDYLIGNKFDVSYLHIFWTILYYQKSERSQYHPIMKRIFLLIHIGVTIWITIFTECNTAMVGCFILFILYFMKNVIYKVLQKPWFGVTFVVVMDSVLVLFSSILNNKIIRFFVEDVLGKDVTLTGRITIYENIGLVLKSNIWLGNGYGSSYAITTMILGAQSPNAQNGLLNIIVETGILGVMCFLFLLYKTISKCTIKSYPILIFIYMFIVLSSVEITFDSFFIAILALLTYCGYDSEKKKEMNGNSQKIVKEIIIES